MGAAHMLSPLSDTNVRMIHGRRFSRPSTDEGVWEGYPDMLDTLVNGIDAALGLGEDSLSLLNMGLRALIVFILALFMLRLGEKRFLGKNTAFDVILGIIFGSVVSRAITGSSSFFPTLGAGLVLVLLHWGLAEIAFRSDRFGNVVKGNPRVLVEDGEIQWDAMRGGNISHDDLLQALRVNASLDDVEQVKIARLERSGDISVITKSSEPRILDVSVHNGVQSIRIQLE